MFGTFPFSLTPLRRDPAHRSEMVNQGLFGEVFEVLGHEREWTHVRLGHDGYEGWVLTAQTAELSRESYRSQLDRPQPVVASTVDLVDHDQPIKSRTVVAGSYLPFLQDGVLELGDDSYRYQGPVAEQRATADEVVRHAFTFLNAPYLWGGRSAFGIDCSGLTQVAFRMAGINLLRDAHQQANQGQIVDFLDEALEGDLAFFDNEEGRITHVGLVLSEHRILHASGSVRVDALDPSGIYHAELGRHTHRLRLIKRFI
ncbi:MAG: C40 family peptidase [Schleiferiaceae bacterium]|jgi:hypothetical protein